MTRLLPRLEEIFEASPEHVVVFHYRSLWVRAWHRVAASKTLGAVCAITSPVYLLVIPYRRVQSHAQLLRMLQRAELYVGGIVATAFAVIATASKRVIVAGAINSGSANHAESSMCAHGFPEIIA